MKAKPTHRYSTLASISWTAFQHIVQLADAAQIPLGGGAVSITKQLIEMYNVRSVQQIRLEPNTLRDHVADDNKNACAAVVETLAAYSETIWDFVQAMDPTYVKESEDARAVIARNGIKRFGSALDEVSYSLKRISNKGKVMGMISASNTRDQLNDCEKRLIRELGHFNGSRMNVLVASVQDLSTKSEPKPTTTEYQILGARRLQPSDDFPGRNAMPIATLCDTLFHAKVDSRVRMVKMYYDHSGGKDAFQNDMMFFQRNPHPNILGIYGYSDTAGVPLVVLRDENLRHAKQQIQRTFVFLMRQYRLKRKALPNVSSFINESGQLVYSTAVYSVPLKHDQELDDSTGPIGQEMADWMDEINKEDASDDDVDSGLGVDNRGLLEFKLCSRFSHWSAGVGVPSSKLWIGDFGVFVVHPRKPVTFRKLGNILNEHWTDSGVPSFPYGKHLIVDHKAGRFSLCVGQQDTQVDEAESSEDDGDSSDSSEFSGFQSILSRRGRTGSRKSSAIMLDDVHPRPLNRHGEDNWVYDGKIHCNLKSRAENFFKTHWTRLKMRYDVDPLDLVIVWGLETPVRVDSGICDCVWSAEDEAYKPSLCLEGPRPTVTIAPSIGFGPPIRTDPCNHCSMEGAHKQDVPPSKPHHCCSHNITFAVDLQDPETELTFLRPPLTGFPNSDDIIDTMPGAWPVREVD